MATPEEWKTIGVIKKSQDNIRERRLSNDLDSYKRLRKNGLQPPRIDGCASLEAHAVTKEEIQMGCVYPWIPAEDRKKAAKERRDATERAKEMDLLPEGTP